MTVAPLPSPPTATTLRRLADSAPLWIAAFDGRLKCFYVNRAFAEGVAPDEAPDRLIGRSLQDLLGTDWPLLRADALDAVLREGRTSRFEMSWPQGRGHGRWVEAVLTPHLSPQEEPLGFFLLIHDLTAHHALERALLESEERLGRFMRASMEGVLFHQDGIIQDANPALCDLVGLRLHELIGTPWIELIEPDLREEVSARLTSDEPVALETTLVDASGTRMPVDLLDRRTLMQGRLTRVTILRDARDRHAAQARMDYLAHHDVLTGLPNRHAFVAHLEHMMVASEAAQTQLALLFIDLDHFKRVNDSVGHTAGDSVLKFISARICDRVRSSDWVARFGGDEFMVLLPGMRDPADVTRVAEKLLACIALPILIDGRPISVTASLGIAVYPSHGLRPQRLIQHADAAMHVAKSRGRARFEVFEESVAHTAYHRLVLEGQLGHAIEHQEFALQFQPQVSAVDGSVTGAEALIRWQHPERGLLTPDEFITLAEQHRLIVPIGTWVLEEAARCAVHWHAQGHPLSVAVNLSSVQFESPDFIAGVTELLAHTPLPRGWLELEITERMLMHDLASARTRLQELRALGVRLSVDDFGTGTSSLGHLRDLPIDKLKIDRTFVQDLSHDPRTQAIARAIIELARGLGLTVVAEGVETASQYQRLRELGCHQLQGLGVSAPLSCQDFDTWLAERRDTSRPCAP